MTLNHIEGILRAKNLTLQKFAEKMLDINLNGFVIKSKNLLTKSFNLKIYRKVFEKSKISQKCLRKSMAEAAWRAHKY